LPHETVDELAGQLGIEAGISLESFRAGGALASHESFLQKTTNHKEQNPNKTQRINSKAQTIGKAIEFFSLEICVVFEI
jgi:hypothetical protein